MARRKREFSIFTMSFLDVMACGFGAVILLYLLLDHRQEIIVQAQASSLRGEVAYLEREIKEDTVDLVELKNSLDEIEQKLVEAHGRSDRVLDETTKRRVELATHDKDTLSEQEHVNQLKTDLKQLEEQNERLRAEADKESGESARSFSGEGDRQYLTGLKLGGQRILILFDRSASMLDHSLVNVIRLRNMPEAAQRRAAKWQRSLATLDWLTAQLPLTSEYQIYSFNTKAEPALSGTAGKWLKVNQREEIDKAVEAMRALVPKDGTNLSAAFAVAATMNPKPDNIYLITDGLPTQGDGGASSGKVSGRDRQKLYNQAIARLPTGVPVNVILEPMEGDPFAASSFWQLAQRTSGAFLAPAQDWP
jgi:hypothetical protein